MTKYVQPGERMEYANAGSAISSGDVVVIGDRIGIALTDIAATSGTGTVELCGVYELAAISTGAFVQGEALYWDASAGKLTNVGTANTPAGTAFEAKASSAALARVRLQPSPERMPVQAAVATADGSDAATTQALANALKTAHNALLVKLKEAGLMKNS
jgi:predicted RecA/RadA family phage recombinase